jgi:hypothetical protein
MGAAGFASKEDMTSKEDATPRGDESMSTASQSKVSSRVGGHLNCYGHGGTEDPFVCGEDTSKSGLPWEWTRQ